MLSKSPKVYTGEDVFDKVLEDIVHLLLEPGMLISENRMGRDFQVSRSVIRSAFGRLRQMGFIDILPQRGSYVSKIDANYIEDLLFLQSAIEKEAVNDILWNLSEQEQKAIIGELETQLSQQKIFAQEGGSYPEFMRLHREFHRKIMEKAKRQRVMDIVGDNLLHLERYRHFEIAHTHITEHLLRENAEMIEVLQSRDFAFAVKKMNEHRDREVHLSRKLIEQYG